MELIGFVISCTNIEKNARMRYNHQILDFYMFGLLFKNNHHVFIFFSVIIQTVRKFLYYLL